MNSDLLNGFMLGILFSLAAEFALSFFKKKAAKQSEQPTPSAPPRRIQARPLQWYPMPCGTLMELGATGFYIRLAPDKDGSAYHGYTPEHLRCVRGNDLAAMKAYLEGEARERAEFEPVARAWRP